jgi:hypothetical protein
MYRFKKEDIELVLSLILLGFGICFTAYLCSPIFDEGFSNAGDNFWHVANIKYLQRLVEEDHRIFGWFNLFDAGQPLLNVYQGLFYTVVVLFYNLTLKSFPIDYITKFMLVFFISMYPASLYYCLMKFRCPKLLCGLASLLPVTSNLAWGNNITAYFFLGIITQSIAMFFFPLAIGALYDSITNKKSILLPAVLIGLVIISHLIVSYMMELSIVLLIILLTIHKRSISPIPLLLRLTCILILAMLLMSFWIMPFISLMKYRSPEELAKYGFFRYQKYSLTTVSFVNNFLEGNVFDGYINDSTQQGYYDNRVYNRPPILTFLIIIGIITCFIFSGRFEYSFLVLGLLFSIILFIGSDDANILLNIPYMREMYHVRAASVMEFFAFCVGGIGLFHLTKIILWIVSLVPVFLYKKFMTLYYHSLPKFYKRLIKLQRFSTYFDVRAFVSGIIVVLIAGLLLMPIYEERFVSGKMLVDVLYPNYIPLMENAKVTLDRDRTPGRLFIGQETGVTDNSIMLLLASYLELPAFMNPSWDMYMTSIVLREFKEPFYHPDTPEHKMYYSKFMRELFNIRYVIFSKNFPTTDEFSSIKENLTYITDIGPYLLYRFNEKSSFFFSPRVKPVLAFVSDNSWYYICLGWAKSVRTMDNNQYNQAFIARAPTEYIDDINLDPLQYPTILLMDYKVRDETVARKKLQEYVAGGGHIISKNESVERLFYLTVVSNAVCSQPSINEIKTGLEYYSYTVESSEKSFIVFPMTYFPNWIVTVDGVEVETFWTTPGVVGFEVPPGRHVVEAKYGYLPAHKIGYMISIITLTAIAMYLLSGKIRGILKDLKVSSDSKIEAVCTSITEKTKDLENRFGVFKNLLYYIDNLLKWAPYILFILMVSYIGLLYAKDLYFGIPSIYEPDNIVTYNPYNILFTTNLISGRNVDFYTFQMDKLESDFSNPIFEQNSTNWLSFYNKFTPNTVYKWRVRSVSGDYTSPWSNVLTFRTNNDPPPSWTINTTIEKYC